MLTSSHFLLGKRIYKIVENRLKFKLNKTSFLIGCIKPDIIGSTINRPHTKDQSIDVVINEINQLSKFPIVDKSSLKQFSNRVGVVCHYIADYFCFAHNDKNMDKLLPHALYEINLAKCLNKLNRLNNTRKYKPLANKQDVKKWINLNHKKYLQGHSGPIKDLEYIINITTILMLSIISRSMTKQKVASFIA